MLQASASCPNKAVKHDDRCSNAPEANTGSMAARPRPGTEDSTRAASVAAAASDRASDSATSAAPSPARATCSVASRMASMPRPLVVLPPLVSLLQNIRRGFSSLSLLICTRRCIMAGIYTLCEHTVLWVHTFGPCKFQSNKANTENV